MGLSEEQLKQAKALVFDYMGTVTDWLTPVATALIANAPKSSTVDWVEFAHRWRKEFFAYTETLADGTEVASLHDVYDRSLSRCQSSLDFEWSSEQREKLIRSWSGLVSWVDSREGLQRLRQKYLVVILSNGSTRVLIDASKRNKLEWDMTFASDMIGAYKPSKKTYQEVIRLLQLKPSECVMVAAHAYDLQAAATHGMGTIYVARETEDRGVNLANYSFDLTIQENGLIGLASALSC
ncbi:hypothetical protein FRC17_005621 [Serendipita sp. 399]|nr:hypothetical protein FRC17_005621 [Serendipita sp. 399]